MRERGKSDHEIIDLRGDNKQFAKPIDVSWVGSIAQCNTVEETRQHYVKGVELSDGSDTTAHRRKRGG